MEGDQKQQQQLGSENGDGRPKPDDGFIASATNVSSKPDQTTHELTALIQGVLQQTQDRFQQMSDQIIGRIDDMTKRIDELEKNITDLMTQAGIEPEM